MRRLEAGFTFIEMLVVSMIVAIMVLLMMPSLQGYQSNAQVRELADQAVAQMRQAAQQAVGIDQQIGWWNFDGDNAPGCSPAADGWVVRTGTGTQESVTCVPSNVGFVAQCYRGAFMPQGGFITPGVLCGGSGATINMICLDSTSPANPLAIEITVVVATGQIVQQQSVNGCP